MNRGRAEFVVAVLLELVGGAGALLISARAWQTVVTPRPRPLADDVLRLTGRTIDSSATALALVALAGVVAVLATRGLVRRLVGVVLAFTGGALVWRALHGLGAVSAERARGFVTARHSGVGLDPAVAPHVTVHPAWPWLTTGCGVLVLAAGVLVAWRGHRWSVMSARYEAPTGGAATEEQQQRANASMWHALDRGDDPTAAGPGSTETGR